MRSRIGARFFFVLGFEHRIAADEDRTDGNVAGVGRFLRKLNRSPNISLVLSWRA